MKNIDYQESGLTIQYAMLDQARRYPRLEERPSFIKWGDLEIHTSDKIKVPKTGSVTASILDVGQNTKQGFDLEIVDGGFRLIDGRSVRVLRTWKDERFEDTVNYEYVSVDGYIYFWNVYERIWPNGSSSEEKWLGNSGFWIERIDQYTRVYHCSNGILDSPDFESLIVSIRID